MYFLESIIFLLTLPHVENLAMSTRWPRALVAISVGGLDEFLARATETGRLVVRRPDIISQNRCKLCRKLVERSIELLHCGSQLFPLFVRKLCCRT
jgi:hypothetical protein